MESPIHLTVYGSACLHIGDETVPIRSTKVRAALAYLALADGPVSREALSWMLWAQGGRRNLRQLLYQIRQLPGGEDWLVTTSESIEVTLTCPGRHADGHGLKQPLPTGEALFRLDDAGTEAFADWVYTTREQLDASRRRARVREANEQLQTAPAQSLKLLQPLLDELAPPLHAAQIALQAFKQLGQVDPARALWDRVAKRVATRPADEQAAWAALRLDMTPDRGGMHHILPALRALVQMEPNPLPPTLVADVLGVDLLDVAAAWSQIPEHDDIPDDLGHAALRAQLAAALEKHGLLDRAAFHYNTLGETARAAQLWWQAGVQSDDLNALVQCAAVSPNEEQSEDAWVLACLGHRLRRDIDRANDVVDAMVKHANRTQRPRFLARARLQQASLMLLLGDGPRSEFAASQLAVLTDASPQLAPLQRLLAGVSCALKRDVKAAIPHLEASFGVGQIEDIQAYLALGACHGQLGDLEPAAAMHREGLARARSLRARRIAGAFLVGLSTTADRAGNKHLSRHYLLELVELGEGFDGALLDTSLCNLATIDLSLGNLGHARAMLSRVLDNQPVPLTRALVYRTRSELERVCGRYAESVGWSERARALYASMEQQADLDIIAFNTALASWYAERTPAAERALHACAQPIFDRGGHFARLVARDVALAAQNITQVQDALERMDGLSDLQSALLTLRAMALQRATGSVDDALIADVLADRSTTSLWGRCLIAYRHPEHAQTLHEGSQECFAALTDGLLSGQRDALSELWARWKDDPIRHAGPL